MLEVSRAEYAEAYRIKVTFNDGQRGEVDLRRVLHEDPRSIFAELRDMEKFKGFKVDFGTVCWSNGLDLAPEYLYFLAFGDKPELRAQFEEWGYLQDEALTNA